MIPDKVDPWSRQKKADAWSLRRLLRLGHLPASGQSQNDCEKSDEVFHPPPILDFRF
jgi:hypothetical protein